MIFPLGKQIFFTGVIPSGSVHVISGAAGRCICVDAFEAYTDAPDVFKVQQGDLTSATSDVGSPYNWAMRYDFDANYLQYRHGSPSKEYWIWKLDEGESMWVSSSQAITGVLEWHYEEV